MQITFEFDPANKVATVNSLRSAAKATIGRSPDLVSLTRIAEAMMAAWHYEQYRRLHDAATGR